MGVVSDWIISILLFSLRVGPVLAFSPPFSLIPVQARIRLLFTLAICACIVAVTPVGSLGNLSIRDLFPAALGELSIGLLMATSFHVAFGAFYFAGRVLDIQAGFGLATLIDPASHQQQPLIGSMLAMAVGLIFFSTDGPAALLRVASKSLELVPLGHAQPFEQPGPVLEYVGYVFAIGLTAVSGTIAVIFVIDIAIAFLARTLPQLNVLVLGFQIKTVTLLLALSASIGILEPVSERVLAASFSFVERMLLTNG